jgi:hypothetical protein
VKVPDLLAALEWNRITVALGNDGSGINVDGITSHKKLYIEIIHSHCDETVEHLRTNQERSASEAGAVVEGVIRGGVGGGDADPLGVPSALHLQDFINRAKRFAHRVDRKWTESV